jgi:excisionase family DNA binding protein
MDNDRLLDAGELSERLGVSKSTVYRMSSKCVIPSVPVGPSLTGRRFSFNAVREALEKIQTTKRPYYPPKDRRIEKVGVRAGG